MVYTFVPAIKEAEAGGTNFKASQSYTVNICK